MERLPPSTGSARVGRQVVAALLTALGRDDLVDDAELVVSELVANAVMHARTELGLSVRASGGGVRVAVTDGSTVHPAGPRRPRRPSADVASSWCSGCAASGASRCTRTAARRCGR